MAHEVPSLETPRLVPRSMELADLPQVQAIFPQWEIVKHPTARVPWPYPANGAEVYFREMVLPARERGEEWLWIIRRKAAPETIIGAITLVKNEHENRGFWLDPRFHRQGLMTEACDAVTEFWFEVLKFPVLRAPKAVANEASRRISMKQGMRVIERMERDYVCGRLPAELWEITAEEWRARKAKIRAVGTHDERV
jgi:[ribosomal protein S5]-alanine N-acetyltransferase